MRMNASLISLLTGIAVAGVLAVTGWTFAAPGSGAVFADKRPNAVPVDVELVLAVDVSYSMDPEEQALQREGYITGITSIRLLTSAKLTYVGLGGFGIEISSTELIDDRGVRD